MANRIRELRAKRNLTLMKLGEKVGLAPNTISQYETGNREPKLETWVKLADYFGVSVAYLQGIEERFEPTSDLEHQQAHDAVWDAVGKLIRAASVGTMSYEEAFQELKRYRNKADELRFKEKQETQQRMFDLALSTFKRRERNEKQ